MIIVAALAFYDEPPAALDRLVRSLDGVVDVLLAVDGAWDLYDPSGHESPAATIDALGDSAGAIGLPLKIPEREPGVVPPSVWQTQWIKRDWMMRRAADEADWVLVIDADEYVLEADPERLRSELAIAEEKGHEVAYVSGEIKGRGGETSRWRRLFRATEGLGVSETHHGYTIRDSYSGEETHLGGDIATRTLRRAYDVADLLVLGHDESLRSQDRRKRARLHYVKRSRSDER